MILGEPFESREKNKHTQAVTENKEKNIRKGTQKWENTIN